ncbi:putative carbohydrate-binding protein [Phytophthora cinnamomi]|uniref:putative carbohydrate-binding protein n=1 Tax=Phytophthora cinnamomi TaxID=4785 RepID=UPI003559477C|nr:putative carbohydrate-binding protein [Phytophthora cinnamomi]
MRPPQLILAALLLVARSHVADAVQVSVCADATYDLASSRGGVCSGSGAAPAGTACPLKGDVAVADCHSYLPSFAAGRCVAPEDAECQLVTGSTWGCVLPSVGCGHPATAPPASECATWDVCEPDVAVDIDTSYLFDGNEEYDESWFVQTSAVRTLSPSSGDDSPEHSSAYNGGPNDTGTNDTDSDDPGTDPGTNHASADTGAYNGGPNDTGADDAVSDDPGTNDTDSDDPGTNDIDSDDPGTDPGTNHASADTGAYNGGPNDTGADDTDSDDPGTNDTYSDDRGTDPGTNYATANTGTNNAKPNNTAADHARTDHANSRDICAYNFTAVSKHNSTCYAYADNALSNHDRACYASTDDAMPEHN